MKLSVALRFAKCIYLTENLTLRLLPLEMMKLVKIYNITMIPKSWQIFIANKISGYLIQFKSRTKFN